MCYFDEKIEIARPTKNMISEKIGAVVVTYYPDHGFIERLHLIQQQFPLVVIVDNSTNTNLLTYLKKSIDTGTVKYIQNNHNLGIATALNQGIRALKEAHYDLVVTFDQDSIIKSNLKQKLYEIYKSNHNALIGSNFWHALKNRKFYSCDDSVTQSARKKTLITSGMLIPIHLYDLLGGFKEDFFIDAVDHEYCLRARQKKLNILISCECLIEHPIGQSQENPPQWVKILFPRKQLTTHAPVRKYYFFRNTIRLFRNYLFYEPVWCIDQTYHLFMKLIASLLLEEHKFTHLKACIVGTVHGLANRGGPAPNGLFD